MKEINIGRVLIKNRHKRGITQDELANHLGVSKGAVSKWETGSSLPDILLLPQLASYFDISIDELIGYQPQMEQEDIKKLYIRLSKDFSMLSFEEVLAECLKIAKKFYACYPLLFELGTLLINHTSQASCPEQVEQIKKSHNLLIYSDLKNFFCLLIVTYCPIGGSQKRLRRTRLHINWFQNINYFRRALELKQTKRFH